MIVGVVRETFPGERRVALTPGVLPTLGKMNTSVLIEAGAGESAGFTDQQYRDAGGEVAADRHAVFSQADIICQVRTIGANPDHGLTDLSAITDKHILIGLAEPLSDVKPIRVLAESGATTFALELIPRITRAQSMDVLSSQATISGYKAVILAAEVLPKMFPMMMTAAGTLAPARVLVLGAGVAGLQAIATSKRNGAVVTGYDIRPVVKEQVESLGAKFLELELEAKSSEDKGGYAKAMDDDFIRRQQEMMTQAVATNDVVITTAAVPGRKAPILVTEAMVKGMAPGSVIVDLAAERGGNCELTVPGETVNVNGVTIIGTMNLPSTTPNHASQMYARNIIALLKHLVVDDALQIDTDDEITEATLLTRNGDIVQRRVREILGIDTPVATEAAAAGEGSGDG